MKNELKLPLRSTLSPTKVAGLGIIELLNDPFFKAFDYRTYQLNKNFARNDDNAANELHKMRKKTAVQMKDQIFSGEATLSAIALLQDFESVCGACNIHKNVVMWI